MNTARLILTAAMAGILLFAGLALAEDFTGQPGYVDLEWIEIPPDAMEIHDIDLGPILLSLAADAEENGDDALVQALAMIHSVRVKAYSVGEDGDATASGAVKKVQAKLSEDDWKRLIYVKDGEETLAVHTFYAEKDLVGLMVVTYEPGDSVAFVNVMGDLDLGTMLRLAKQIDEDSLEDMIEELEGIDGIEIHDDHDDG